MYEWEGFQSMDGDNKKLLKGICDRIREGEAPKTSISHPLDQGKRPFNIPNNIFNDNPHLQPPSALIFSS